MEFLRNTIPILILAALLILSPAINFGPIPDLCFVCGLAAFTIIVGGILFFLG